MHMIQLEIMKKFSDDRVRLKITTRILLLIIEKNYNNSQALCFLLQQTVTVIEFLVTQMMKMRKLMADKMDGLTELEQIYK